MTVHAQRSGGVEAVGLLLADNHGGLNVVAASSEQARVLELFQLPHAEGPCLDCYRAGGRASHQRPWTAGSPPCMPCRCGCGIRPSGG